MSHCQNGMVGNIRHGCILRRPCLCSDLNVLARTLCPVHMIWPRVIERVRIGEFLFPDLSAAGFNKELRITMADAGYSYAAMFSSHCFRRGATQELQIAESPEATIKSAGCWRAAGFRAYVDTQMTDALKIARLVASAINSDSDEEDSPATVAFGKALKKRLRVFPAGELKVRTA